MTVSGDEFEFIFDRARGGLKSWTSKGQTLISPALEQKVSLVPSFWRPSTDNDAPISLPYWIRFGVDALTSQLRSFEVESSSDRVEIKAHTFISPPVLDWGWDSEISYIISGNGTLDINVTRLEPSGLKPEHVPRIGLDISLPRALDQVTWLGLGPGESYPDKKASRSVGVWGSLSVNDLQTPYDVPQENGNRLETRWVVLTDSETHKSGIRVSRPSSDLFSFAASHHSAKTIQAARHPTDLVEDDAVYLRLDAKTAGVGTAACGPGVRDDDLVKTEPIKFQFRLEHV